MSNGSPFIKWESIGLVQPFGPIPAAARFFIEPLSQNERFVALLPAINANSLSGDPNTILRFLGMVARNDINVVVLSLQGAPMGQEDFTRHLIQTLGIPAEAASRIQLKGALAGSVIMRGDRIMATASWTFELARQLAKKCGSREPAYFIQDIEPMLLGLGIEHAQLMQSWQAESLPIINSEPLAETLFGFPGTFFSSSECRQKALVFNPSVDRALFHRESTRNDKKRLFIYSRLGDNESRNMSRLCLEAVSNLVKEGMITLDQWDIRCYGTPGIPPIVFENGVQTTMLPALSQEEYAQELRSASLGMALALSPHPGYLAFELAACGVPVITNTYLSKTNDYLKGISPLIHPVDPTVNAITAQLRNMLLTRQFKDNSEQADALPSLDLPDTWEKSFEPIMERFLAWFHNK